MPKHKKLIVVDESFIAPYSNEYRKRKRRDATPDEKEHWYNVSDCKNLIVDLPKTETLDSNNPDAPATEKVEPQVGAIYTSEIQVAYNINTDGAIKTQLNRMANDYPHLDTALMVSRTNYFRNVKSIWIQFTFIDKQEQTA